MSETSYKWIDKTPTILKYSNETFIILVSRLLENIELRNFQVVVLRDRGKETKCVS